MFWRGAREIFSNEAASYRIRSRFKQATIFAFGLRQMLFCLLSHTDIPDRCHNQSPLYVFE